MLERMWRKGNPLALLVGMQIDTVTLEKCGGLVTKLCLTLGTPWTGVHLTSLSTGFSRQEYWSGLPFPPLGGLPNPGIEPMSPASPALAGRSLPLSHLGNPVNTLVRYLLTNTAG